MSDKIDAALEMYYIRMGRRDYRNIKSGIHRNKGKFKAFWDENEYNSSDVDDELGQDAEYDNCSYLEFDNDFPVNPSIIDQDEKQKEIFRIFQNCYKYGNDLNPKNTFSLTSNFMKSQVFINFVSLFTTYRNAKQNTQHHKKDTKSRVRFII